MRLPCRMDVWITGLRRTQASTRRGISKVERHVVGEGRTLLKLNPLYDDGYASIGCEPCTARIAPGEHERAGRWRGVGKTECGLHTFTRRE